MKRKLKNKVKMLVISGYLILILSFVSSNYYNNSKILPVDNDLNLNQSAPDYWPDSGWRTSSPESENISAQILDELENHIDNNELHYFMDSLLIVRNGYLVYELYPPSVMSYDDNALHHLYSATTVFISALIGIALNDGYIGGIDDYILDYFPDMVFDNMDSQKEQITIKHLLTMTSGINWTDYIDYYSMRYYDDWVQYVLDQPMVHQPGEVWNYNSGGVHILSVLLDRVTPNGTRAYIETSLFEPLNITNYLWYNDNDWVPNGANQLYLTPRDMTKFGLLYLNNGSWNSDQLIPSEWVSESSTSYINVEFDEGQGSGYGYQWWTYEWANAYTTRGFNQQYIVVIPDFNTVVVFTGSYYFSVTELLVNYILPSLGYSEPYIIHEIYPVISLITISVFTILLVFFTRNKRPIARLKEA